MEGSVQLTQKIFFSFGHFYNDLTSAMWFTYLLVYLTGVAKLSSLYAGYLLLLGQIVDGCFTPLVGYESDKKSGFFGYSKRKSWHLIGTILVTCSFPFLFLPVFGGLYASDLVRAFYYTPFVIMFQIGWASVQISHLSLVADLTPNPSQRVSLYSYRNAMTLVANIVVYGFVWEIFSTRGTSEWTAADAKLFMILVFIILGLGLTSSTIFHIFLKENHHERQISSYNEDEKNSMEWKDWFKEKQFYVVAIAYMGSRLVMNVSQTYWPFYIIDSLKLSKKFVAIIPLIVYSSGFLTSLLMEKINSFFGRKPTYLLGTIVTAGSLMWLAFITQSTKQQIYGPAVIIGMGSTILLITSLSMIADLIGNNTNTSAFVYGVMSFVDKLTSGAALMLIQALQKQFTNDSQEISIFFKDVMTYVLASFDLICFISFFALIPFTLGKLSKNNTEVVDEERQALH